MTPRKYLFSLSGIVLFGWIAFVLVITKLTPCTAPGKITLCHAVSPLSLTAFFLSLFIALLGTFSLGGFCLRIWFTDEVYREHLYISIRQGLLLSICLLGSLTLLLLNSLTWWSGGLLIGIAVLLETYFNR